MASIKFYPHKEVGVSKVYIRLTLKKRFDFRLSTGLTIQEASDWNVNTSMPKKNSANNKALHASLQNLENHIENVILSIENSRDDSINNLSSKWLKILISEYFNETPIEDKNLLVSYAKSYSEGLKKRTYQRSGKRIKFSDITIEKYVNFANQLEKYQEHLNKRIQLTDVDNKFSEDFSDYLKDVKKLAVNTIGRELKRLKTIVKDAENKGYRINNNYKEIKGFEDETVVNFLTFEEIDTIIEKKMPDKKLETAKDWLIIGCYTAQRISDMFRMKKRMIANINGQNFITLKQYKTGKQVMIPIHYKVQDVLDKYGNDFPPNLLENEKSNRSTLSDAMKKVCEIAEINQIERGRYNGVLGLYPKYKLIQNHSCRRAFCSNFYGMDGWTTPMIMSITGHLSEKSFLKYIDKEDSFLSMQAAQNFAKMKENDLKEKRKRILKKA